MPLCSYQKDDVLTKYECIMMYTNQSTITRTSFSFPHVLLKFIYSEKATKLDLTCTKQDKCKVVIFQKFCGILTKPQLYHIALK